MTDAEIHFIMFVLGYIFFKVELPLHLDKFWGYSEDPWEVLR